MFTQNENRTIPIDLLLFETSVLLKKKRFNEM